MEMCYDGTLVLPSSYSVMDEEEMTYVEGGKVYSISISKKLCGDIAAGYAGVAAVAQLCNAIPVYGTGLAMGLSAALGICSAYFWLASNHRGMTLKLICVGKAITGAIPIIRW